MSDLSLAQIKARQQLLLVAAAIFALAALACIAMVVLAPTGQYIPSPDGFYNPYYATDVSL